MRTKNSTIYKLQLFLFFTIVLLVSCNTSKINSAQKTYQLSKSDRARIIGEIEDIMESDEQYRAIIALGTFDQKTINKDKELRESASLEDYLAFKKTVKKTLSKTQNDSLWNLQHKLDYNNYTKFKTLVEEYGYPSKERLGIKDDYLFTILLHPPIEIEPTKYLNEMSKFLLPEVKSNRMPAKLYATFYDNIKAKILKEPQLYGTNQTYNPETMSIGNPKISNIRKTNNAREKIGLPKLNEGEYDIIK